MAREKKTKEVKQESLESVLWASANKLRGGVPPYDYMNVVQRFASHLTMFLKNTLCLSF